MTIGNLLQFKNLIRSYKTPFLAKSKNPSLKTVKKSRTHYFLFN